MFDVPTEKGVVFLCVRSRQPAIEGFLSFAVVVLPDAGITPPPLCLSIGPLQMILASTDPAVDAGWVDSVGLTVLHRVAEALDLPYLALLLEERQKSQGGCCLAPP